MLFLIKLSLTSFRACYGLNVFVCFPHPTHSHIETLSGAWLDDVRTQNLWEELRSWGWSPQE